MALLINNLLKLHRSVISHLPGCKKSLIGENYHLASGKRKGTRYIYQHILCIYQLITNIYNCIIIINRKDQHYRQLTVVALNGFLIMIYNYCKALVDELLTFSKAIS